MGLGVKDSRISSSRPWKGELSPFVVVTFCMVREVSARDCGNFHILHVLDYVSSTFVVIAGLASL